MMDAQETVSKLDLSGLSQSDAEMIRLDVNSYFNGTVPKPYFRKQSQMYDKSTDQYRQISKKIFVDRSNPFAKADDIKRKDLADAKIIQFEKLSDIYESLYKTLPRVKRN